MGNSKAEMIQNFFFPMVPKFRPLKGSGSLLHLLDFCRMGLKGVSRI